MGYRSSFDTRICGLAEGDTNSCSKWLNWDNIFSKCITVLHQALAAARYLKRDTHFCCKWWMCYCAQLITRSFSSTLHSSVLYWEGCKQIIPIGREDDDEPSAHCAELKWCIHFHCVRIWLIVFHSLLRGLTIDSIVQNFFFSRGTNLKI